MATEKHIAASCLDGGLTAFASGAYRLHVVKNYVISDSGTTATTLVSSGGRSMSYTTVTVSAISNVVGGTAPKVSRKVTITPGGTITVPASCSANGVSDELGVIVVTNASPPVILLSTPLTPNSSIDPTNVLTISAFELQLTQPA